MGPGEEIGRGGFGTVYRVDQVEPFPRVVAVKMLWAAGLNRSVQQAFQRECRAMGLLADHPNIVTVHDAGTTDQGLPYLVMAYVPGGSLQQRLDDVGPLPVSEVLVTGVKLAGALESAHRAGVVHRDVKPANVLISAFGEPLLTDFGIARVGAATQASATGLAFTLAHAPPEVFDGQKAVESGDVYSLGSTLYALLAGRAPFESDDENNQFAVMKRVAFDPPPDLRPYGVPSDFWEVLAWSLAKDPGQRPASAALFGEALQRVQSAVGHSATAIPLAEMVASATEERNRHVVVGPSPEQVDGFGPPEQSDTENARTRPVPPQLPPVPPRLPEGRAGEDPSRSRSRRVALAAGVGLVVLLVAAIALFGRGEGDDTMVPDVTAGDLDDGDTDAIDPPEGAGDTADTDLDDDATDDPDLGEVDTDAIDPLAGAVGGTLVWAHEQEPPDLHLDDPDNNLSITSWIQQSMLEGLYGITADITFFPELLAAEADVTVAADGTATAEFTLRDGLVWSDGEPLTSADVEFNFNMIMATDDADEFIYPLRDRTGYATITDFTVNSDTEFTIMWSAFHSGFPAMFARLYPAHVFPDDPAEAATAVNDALREWSIDGTTMPSSGPLVFDSWNRGQSMNFVRNDNYHGSNSPDVQNTGPAYVNAVELRFVTFSDDLIDALLANEAHFIFAQPGPEFESLASDDNITIASLAGTVYEHWSFNVNNVHLAKPEVREALALSIDKAEVMAGLYTPLFGDALPAEGLGNVYWMSNQPAYVDHQTEAGYGQGNHDAARANLEGVGYVEGADGIYEHPEDGRLELRVGTTGGNVLREIQLELLQAGFGNAGIDIQIDNVDGAAYFDARPFNRAHIECARSGGEAGNCELWEITQFALLAYAWPGASQHIDYRSGSAGNPSGYQNTEFDALADECDATVDDDERANCYNELNRYVTTLEVDPNGLVVIPLTQKPSFYAYSNTLAQAAVSPDDYGAGPLVNVVDYRFD